VVVSKKNYFPELAKPDYLKLGRLVTETFFCIQRKRASLGRALQVTQLSFVSSTYVRSSKFERSPT
jgi:hypothetical protein